MYDHAENFKISKNSWKIQQEKVFLKLHILIPHNHLKDDKKGRQK